MKRILIFLGLKIAEIVGAGIAVFLLCLITILLPSGLMDKLVELMMLIFPETGSIGDRILIIVNYIALLIFIALWIRKNWRWAKTLSSGKMEG